MDGVRTGDLGGGDDPVDFEVGFLAGGGSNADRFIGELNVHGIHVGFGINGDGLDIKLATGADDAESDFTAIGN
jgi:hypothetical protein